METVARGGVDGISCQHFHVTRRQLPQKHCGRGKKTGERRSDTAAKNNQRRTLPACGDVARSTHIATIWGDRIPPCMDYSSPFARDGIRERTSNLRTSREQLRPCEVHPPRERPTIWSKLAKHSCANVETCWKRKKRNEEPGMVTIRYAVFSGLTVNSGVTPARTLATDDEGADSGSRNMRSESRTACLWWSSTTRSRRT